MNFTDIGEYYSSSLFRRDNPERALFYCQRLLEMGGKCIEFESNPTFPQNRTTSTVINPFRRFTIGRRRRDAS